MPSRDDQKIIRTPSFRAKLQSIKGMSAEEKALYLRIGNLIDFLSYNTRQESNPLGRARKKSVEIPIPQNVVATAISGGVVLTWDPVDFSQLSFYEVQFSDDAVFTNPAAFQVIDTRFVLRTNFTSTTFMRVRTVSKQGLVSGFSDVPSIEVANANIFVDFDFIEPENRTTVLPKPTLVGASLPASTGDLTSVGVGAVFSGSPLTLTDNFSGFPTTGDRRNEITYDLFDVENPFPSLEQRISGPPDHFLEKDSFYTLAEPGTGKRFYIDTFIYPSSFVDFFATQPVEFNPSEIDVEFLRYRIVRDFYFPDYSQTGITLSATMAAIRL